MRSFDDPEYVWRLLVIMIGLVFGDSWMNFAHPSTEARGVSLFVLGLLIIGQLIYLRVRPK